MIYAKVEQLRDELVGLRPVYTEIGNCTELLLKSGEVVLDRRVLQSVVKALAAAYAVDLKAQRRLLQSRLNRQGVLPFYLGKGRVFVPLKMRQAVAENDAVYGYVDLACITEALGTNDRGCVIRLANGLELEILSSQSTVLGIQHTGKVVLAIFQPALIGEGVEELVIKAVRAIITALTDQTRHLERIEEKLKKRNED